MLTYAITLLVLGLVLILIELFLPGGILGFLGAAALIAALIIAFRQSQTTGAIFLAIIIIVVPILVITGLKIFPKTFVGKRVILKPTTETSDQRGAPGVINHDYAALINQNGKTVTPLRPSGIIEINGERYSAVAEGEMINPDTNVTVIRIQGNSIVVIPRETSGA